MFPPILLDLPPFPQSSNLLALKNSGLSQSRIIVIHPLGLLSL